MIDHSETESKESVRTGIFIAVAIFIVMVIIMIFYLKSIIDSSDNKNRFSGNLPPGAEIIKQNMHYATFKLGNKYFLASVQDPLKTEDTALTEVNSNAAYSMTNR